MDRGIVYLLYGMGVAERLVVSMWSLRRHYDGPVTVMTGGDPETALAKSLKGSLGCRCLPFDPESLGVGRAVHAKTRVPELTPYDDTLFLDADTLVTGPLDELFGHDLTLTRYANRTTRNRCPKKWIGAWRGIDRETDELVRSQLAIVFPFINAGVFAFKRGNPDMARWKQLADKRPRARMVEELSLQLLTHEIDHRMMDERFNRCPTWGKAIEDIRVWHFHGRRHCSVKENCASIWIPAFLKVLKKNVAGLSEWAGRYDASLRNWMGATA